MNERTFQMGNIINKYNSARGDVGRFDDVSPAFERRAAVRARVHMARVIRFRGRVCAPADCRSHYCPSAERAACRRVLGAALRPAAFPAVCAPPSRGAPRRMRGSPNKRRASRFLTFRYASLATLVCQLPICRVSTVRTFSHLSA